jgi:hypothetical protein
MGFMANLLEKGPPLSRLRLLEASRRPEPVGTFLLTTRWQ